MRFHIRARVLGAAAIAVLLLGAVGAQASADSTGTKYVDDDGRAGASGCGSSKGAYTRIQDAIDASGAGGIVVVCPGTYRGNLEISGPTKSGLQLRAATNGTARVRAPQAGGTNPLLAIINADGVLVRGLVFQAPTSSPCRRVTALILVDSSLGTRLRQDRLEPVGGNTVGPCGFVDGIDIVNGAEAVVDEVSVRDFRQFGIWVRDPTTFVIVEDSRISFFHANESKEALANAAPAPIGLYGWRGASVIFRRNVVRSLDTGGQSTPLLPSGIRVYNQITNPVIARNTVSYVTYAIGGTAKGGRITDNVAHHGRRSEPADPPFGLFLSGGQGIDVSGNSIRQFGYGARVDGGATDHDIRDNDFRGNRIYDCYDDTSGGGGTSGTSNFWTNDRGDTDSPSGLCRP